MLFLLNFNMISLSFFKHIDKRKVFPIKKDPDWACFKIKELLLISEDFLIMRLKISQFPYP